MGTVSTVARADQRRAAAPVRREITGGIGHISDVAALAGSLAARDLTSSLRDLLRGLEISLAPHTAWEEQWLYPRLDERFGAESLTPPLRFEHGQINRAICALELHLDGLRHEPGHGQLTQLRADLYALDTLIRAHLEREDRFLLPALDAALAAGTAD